jgi:hypothetical protein
MFQNLPFNIERRATRLLGLEVRPRGCISIVRLLIFIVPNHFVTLDDVQQNIALQSRSQIINPAGSPTNPTAGPPNLVLWPRIGLHGNRDLEPNSYSKAVPKLKTHGKTGIY